VAPGTAFNQAHDPLNLCCLYAPCRGTIASDARRGAVRPRHEPRSWCGAKWLTEFGLGSGICPPQATATPPGPSQIRPAWLLLTTPLRSRGWPAYTRENAWARSMRTVECALAPPQTGESHEEKHREEVVRPACDRGLRQSRRSDSHWADKPGRRREAGIGPLAGRLIRRAAVKAVRAPGGSASVWSRPAASPGRRMARELHSDCPSTQAVPPLHTLTRYLRR
jgi:hypothetical protein